MIELLAGMALLAFALLPLAHSLVSEKRLARAYYQRAVAMEIVDGEIEVLAAGAWRSFGEGEHSYSVKAASAVNLPPGRFLLTIHDGSARLEWRPAINHHGGTVIREARLQ